MFLLFFFELISLWRLWCPLTGSTNAAKTHTRFEWKEVLLLGTFYLFWTVYLPWWYQHLHMAFPQFTVMQRSLQSVLGLPPRTQRTKGCRFVHLLRCEGHRDREDVSPVNKAQPTHRALVSCCLFGISTEVLLHQTFLFKCCQHHMSVRQID